MNYILLPTDTNLALTKAAPVLGDSGMFPGPWEGPLGARSPREATHPTLLGSVPSRRRGPPAAPLSDRAAGPLHAAGTKGLVSCRPPRGLCPGWGGARPRVTLRAASAGGRLASGCSLPRLPPPATPAVTPCGSLPGAIPWVERPQRLPHVPPRVF